MKSFVLQHSDVSLTAAGISVHIDVSIGHMARFEVVRDGQFSAAFHRVPWADDAALEGRERFASAPHLERMSGDFFCAPFALSDVEPAPSHGWPANSSWTVVSNEKWHGGQTVVMVLDRPVMGARLLKTLTVRDHHPFLYQKHTFEGGAGQVPVANHAMVTLPHGGTLSTSPKQFATTPKQALETDPLRGRSVLKYPAVGKDLRQFPRADGQTADLLRYPLDVGHDDFVTLVEQKGATLGWTAVVRSQERDVALMLKNPIELPVTMLWYSHGGRHYWPWNSQHRHVLGVEDGCADAVHGHLSSISDNDLSLRGIKTAIALKPTGSVDVRHVIGSVPIPDGCTEVLALRSRPGILEMECLAKTLELPFDDTFL